MSTKSASDARDEKRISFGKPGNIVRQLTQFSGESALDEKTSRAFINLMQKAVAGTALKSSDTKKRFDRQNTINHVNPAISNMKQVEERLQGLDTVVLLAALLAGVGVEAQGGLDNVDDMWGHLALFCLHAGVMTTLTVTIVITCMSVHTRRCFEVAKSVTGALHLLDELSPMFLLAYGIGIAGCLLIMIGLTLLTCIRDDDLAAIILNMIITAVCCGIIGYALRFIFQKEVESQKHRPKYYMVKYNQVPKSSIMIICQDETEEDNFWLFSRKWESYSQFIYNFQCDDPSKCAVTLPTTTVYAIGWIKDYIKAKAYKNAHSKINTYGTTLKTMLETDDHDRVEGLTFDCFLEILNAACVLGISDLLDVLQCLFVSKCNKLTVKEVFTIFDEKEWQIGEHILEEAQVDTEKSQLQELILPANDSDIAALDEDLEEDSADGNVLITLIPGVDTSRDKILDHIKDTYANLYEGVDVNYPGETEFWEKAVQRLRMYDPDLTITKKELSLCKNFQADLSDENNTLKIEQVDDTTLKVVIKYLKRHNGKDPSRISKPIRSVDMRKIIEDTWDAEFINSLGKRALFKVITAANYLNCTSLLHLGCAKVATMIRGKSPDEIKKILGDEEEEENGGELVKASEKVTKKTTSDV